MKKVLIALFEIMLLTLSAVVVRAVGDLSVTVDGRQIPAYEEGMVQIYSLDMSPEVVEGQVYLSLRTIAAYWGADILWRGYDKSVWIDYGGKSAIVKIGSEIAIKNGLEVKLNNAPHIKTGRTMVAAELIEDIFNCEISLFGETIEIKSRPLYLDDMEIVSVQNGRHGFLSYSISESKTDLCVSRLYLLIEEICADEIPEPDYYGRTQHEGGDIHTYYYQENELFFMETAGTAVRRYDIYQRISEDPELSGIMEQQGTDYGEFILHDYTNNKWYKTTTSDFFSEYNDIIAIGEWENVLYD